MAKEKAAAPDVELVVIHPFGDYQRGDHITDPKAIADVLASENVVQVNQVTKQQ